MTDDEYRKVKALVELIDDYLDTSGCCAVPDVAALLQAMRAVRMLLFDREYQRPASA